MYGLEPATIEQIRRVLSEHPQVAKAILYGSRAKGNHRPGSDIDLTLQGGQLTLSVLNRISWQLDDLLLPYSIDLSIYEQIDNPDLIDHIKRVGVEFYTRAD